MNLFREKTSLPKSKIRQIIFHLENHIGLYIIHTKLHVRHKCVLKLWFILTNTPYSKIVLCVHAGKMKNAYHFFFIVEIILRQNSYWLSFLFLLDLNIIDTNLLLSSNVNLYLQIKKHVINSLLSFIISSPSRSV